MAAGDREGPGAKPVRSGLTLAPTRGILSLTRLPGTYRGLVSLAEWLESYTSRTEWAPEPLMLQGHVVVLSESESAQATCCLPVQGLITPCSSRPCRTMSRHMTPIKHYVYKLTCKPTGETYVGRTRNMKRRLKDHEDKSRSGRSMLLYARWREFGREQFDVEILERCDSRDESVVAEGLWVKQLDSKLNTCLRPSANTAHMGRPQQFDHERARVLLESGARGAEVARELGCSVARVSPLRRELGLGPGKHTGRKPRVNPRTVLGGVSMGLSRPDTAALAGCSLARVDQIIRAA